MAIRMLSKAALPAVTGVGRESSPSVSIADNGQIRFSTMITKEWIGKSDKLFLTFDDETRVLTFQPCMAPPKGHTEEELFPISKGKDGEGKQAYFGASALLRSPEAGIEYDFKASGTQVFNEVTTIKGKTGDIKAFSIVLPHSLTPRPKQVRAAKNAPAATPAPTVKAPTADVDDDD